MENLRQRVRGDLKSHEWTQPLKELPSDVATASGGARIGVAMPPIRQGTRDLLLRPPEREWSVAGFTAAIFNVLCAPATPGARTATARATA